MSGDLFNVDLNTGQWPVSSTLMGLIPSSAIEVTYRLLMKRRKKGSTP